MGRHRVRLRPDRLTEQSGQTEVDDPQSSIVTEHQLRRGQLGVHEPAAVCVVEPTARFETDRQRLRRREPAATIEQVAQAAATQMFDHDIGGRGVIDPRHPPVEHGSDVGMAHGGDRAHRLVELGAERR